MTSKFFIMPIACAAMFALAACGEEAAEAPNSVASESAAPETLANGMTVKAQIEARQAGFKELGKAFKAISDQLRSGNPDMSIIQPAAASVPEITQDMGSWFPAGTGPESGVKTEALSAIWEKPEDFALKVGNFQTAAAALVVASNTGDAAAVTAAFRATGGTCGACHDNFRLDD
ncbi:MAG: cytochrome c [Pseudomonadota bacterium]